MPATLGAGGWEAVLVEKRGHNHRISLPFRQAKSCGKEMPPVLDYFI